MKKQGNWELCASAICGTPLEIERGAYNYDDFKGDWQAEIYITAPNSFEWSNSTLWTASYFETIDGEAEKRNEKECLFLTEDEAVKFIKQEFEIDLSIEQYNFY